MDQRLILQQDPVQVKSMNDFTSSLGQALAEVEGIPSKELTRELLADGLRRALEMVGESSKKHFLEILSANIHKFALQEQYSLSRVYPVEISSEYGNLQSFFDLGEEAAGEVAEPTALTELRQILAALPQTPGPSAQEFVAKLKTEQSSQALKAVAARARSGFFGEVRQNLYRLPEASQKELVELFGELKAEVVKMVDSMSQEVSVWLDEERVAAAWNNQAKQASLMSQAENLFQAVLSASFQANFKHIGAGAKRAKEAFLLQTAVCLKTGAERRLWEAPALSDLAARMRRAFFYVEGYGELMEDWLTSRIKQLNEEFLKRSGVALGSAKVMPRLRQIFRPGRWMFLADPRVEGELISLFQDSMPRHVLSTATLKRLLEMVASHGEDFHVYNDILRLPPLNLPCMGPKDAVEAALLEVLKRLPNFPPLLRLPGKRYRFGRVEVVFQLTGTELAAQVMVAPQMSSEVLRALDFFVQYGPQEYPQAAREAVKVSDTLMSPTTLIQDVNAPQPPPMAVAPPAPAMAPAMVAMAPGAMPKFGIEDDEI